MTSLIQARMPEDLAAAARQRAKEQDVSLSAYVASLVRRDMAAARREQFWADVERTMTSAAARADLAADVGELDGTLADGLDS